MLTAIVSPRPDVAASIWLLHLRWVAVFGQLLTVSVVSYYFGEQLASAPLFVLVGVTAATNVVYGVWLRDESHHADFSDDDFVQLKTIVVFGLMAVDLVTLTGMLYFSGGVDNPFSAFYFVNLAVAGIILRPRWAWSLAVIAVLGFCLLMIWHVPLEALHASDSDEQTRTRHIGGLVSFVTCASVITFFVTSTAEELVRRERQLREVEEEQSRGRQLDALSTLAAGAAHELATPMSTVMLIARELQHHLENVDVPDSVRNDLKLIDSELRLCRSILSRMRSAAGDHSSEQWGKKTLGELIDVVLEGIREPHRVEIADVPEEVENALLWLPCEAVAQAIRNLIHNGLDASDHEATVDVKVRLSEETIFFDIHDQGEGMSPATLDRIGQPFFTTKEPGRGMGLGLFLTRNVIQRLGGTLRFESTLGSGTIAHLQLPRAPHTTHTSVSRG